MRFPITEYFEILYPSGANALGFGPERGFGWEGLDPFPGHGPIDVAINSDLNSYALNVELFGWVAGSLLILALFLIGGRKRPGDWGYLAAAVCVVAIQSAYWFAGGPDFGARYWYPVIIPCILLTARGIEWLRERSEAKEVVTLAVGALILGALVLFIPWRAIDKYRGYRGMSPEPAGFMETQAFGSNDLILITGQRHPDYHAVSMLNPIEPTAPGPWFAWDGRSGTKARLEAAYPGRRLWVIEGPSKTGGGYRVVERPGDMAEGVGAMFENE
jgi:hypothetical protein